MVKVKYMNKNKSTISIQAIDGEVWSDIPGWGGLYKISTLGRIYSIRRRKILVPVKNGPITKDKQQYLTIKLCLQKQYQCKIHRLVAQTFLDNPENLPEVNHKDSDRANNALSNLEWVDHDQNMKHAAEHCRMKTEKPLRLVYEFIHKSGDKFYIVGYENLKKHFNYRANPWEVLPSIVNTGEYTRKGKLKGFMINSYKLKDQRLSQLGVELSDSKESTSLMDENIV
jgi:hypothetical protein